ncbi:N-acetylglucosaminyldiphosphodolichol N-acetylglucosaminyltransferase catalytic subunit alg13 [Ciborinia camelliae]|nr:N-acetylglucosaminyldiphosphodolichol N-acetylglucosaminyltransferase catalytic subunit alg13 [Ciborinia camelliae]
MQFVPEGATPKVAFVTVGATATFKELIEEVFAPHTLQALVQEGYTKLRIQAGRDADYWKNVIPAEKGFGLKIEVFDFDRNGLGHEMRQCKKGGFYGTGKSLEGVVISHAGSGSILDALRIDVPLIVVPNTSLLDNHQAELADELERQGYLTKASGPCDLEEAIYKAERKKDGAPDVSKDWQKRKNWRGHGNPTVAPVLDEAANYEEEVRSVLD